MWADAFPGGSTALAPQLCRQNCRSPDFGPWLELGGPGVSAHGAWTPELTDVCLLGAGSAWGVGAAESGGSACSSKASHASPILLLCLTLATRELWARDGLVEPRGDDNHNGYSTSEG